MGLCFYRPYCSIDYWFISAVHHIHPNTRYTLIHVPVVLVIFLSESSLVESLSVDLFPARSSAPSTPVRNYFGRNRLSQLLLQCGQPILSLGRSSSRCNPRKPSTDMKIILSRPLTSNESTSWKVRRKYLKNVVPEVNPVFLRLLEKSEFDFFRRFALVDSEETTVPRDLCIVERFESCCIRGSDVFVESCLAYIR